MLGSIKKGTLKQNYRLIFCKKNYYCVVFLKSWQTTITSSTKSPFKPISEKASITLAGSIHTE